MHIKKLLDKNNEMYNKLLNEKNNEIKKLEDELNSKNTKIVKLHSVIENLEEKYQDLKLIVEKAATRQTNNTISPSRTDSILKEKYETQIREYKERQTKELKERDEKIEQMSCQLVLLKQEIKETSLEKYINEICDQFRMNCSIENYKGCNCLYVLYVDKIEQDGNVFHILKFGESSNIENRLIQHKLKFKNLRVMYIANVKNSSIAEGKFKDWLKKKELLYRYESYTEMIRIENEDQLFDMKDKIDYISKENNAMDETEILKFKLEQYEERLNIEKELRLSLTSRLKTSM